MGPNVVRVREACWRPLVNWKREVILRGCRGAFVEYVTTIFDMAVRVGCGKEMRGAVNDHVRSPQLGRQVRAIRVAQWQGSCMPSGWCDLRPRGRCARAGAEEAGAHSYFTVFGVSNEIRRTYHIPASGVGLSTGR